MPQGYIWYSPLAKAMLGGALAVSSALSAGPADAQAVRTANVLSSVTVPTPRSADVRMVNDGGAPTLETATRMAEDYFNSLTTLQADFSQSVTGEAFGSEGTFYLSKPRRFLWQYDTPTRQKIVSTGTAVYYVDQSSAKGDGQVTQLPMDAGLGRLFNTKTLKLNGQGLRVTGVTSNPRQITLNLLIEKSSKAENQAGLKSVRLTFNRQPFTLASIEALDTLQVTTKVTFANLRTGLPLPPTMFDFTPGVYKSAN